MIDLRRYRKLYDETVEEYLDTIPYELDGDGVGFWVIVPAGRSFQFEGDDLAEFVRLCILRLVDVGGIPVRHSDEGPLRWSAQKHFGQTNAESADAIVAEWLAAGGGDPDWESLWFVTPRVLNSDPFR